jgi:hypothetical protein
VEGERKGNEKGNVQNKERKGWIRRRNKNRDEV